MKENFVSQAGFEPASPRNQGRSQGGILGCPWPPLCKPFCKQTAYNIQVTIWWVPYVWISVTPPLKNPGYAHARNSSSGVISTTPPGHHIGNKATLLMWVGRAWPIQGTFFFQDICVYNHGSSLTNQGSTRLWQHIFWNHQFSVLPSFRPVPVSGQKNGKRGCSGE